MPAPLATCREPANVQNRPPSVLYILEHKLEQLMITHTIESYWIPSQKKTKSKLQI